MKIHLIDGTYELFQFREAMKNPVDLGDFLRELEAELESKKPQPRDVG